MQQPLSKYEQIKNNDGKSTCLAVFIKRSMFESVKKYTIQYGTALSNVQWRISALLVRGMRNGMRELDEIFSRWWRFGLIY